MNSFEKTISILGLSTDSQGDSAWLYALLIYAADNSSGEDTYSNPAREVLRRLEAANVGAHTLRKLTEMLNAAIVAVDSGRVAA